MKRAEFITEHRRGCWSMTDLCEAFGISRKTGYEMLARYRKHGLEALSDRSRAPHRHPNKTPDDVAARIVAVRQDHPTWGVKKVLAWLAKREPVRIWPARSTAERILGEADLVQVRRRRRRPVRVARTVPVAAKPNNLWCQDYKGWFRLGNGQRCDPYTLTDAASRMALNCTALLSPVLEDVQQCLIAAFKEYGMPDAMLSDNGPPFGSTSALGGLTRLGVWLLRLGVTPHFIDPGRPEQNGQHERFHFTLQEATSSPPRRTPRAQQMAFNRFRSEFNYERPHEALGMATPGEIYQPSSRSYPARLPEWVYPVDFATRQVRMCGTIKWHNQPVRIGLPFSGELIGLESVADGVIRVYLGTLPLGHFHEGSRKVIPIPR